MTDQQMTTTNVDEHDDEGHSALGWVCVFIIVIGFAIGTLFFFLDVPLMVWIGAGIIVVGAILWPVLKLAGLGAKAH